MIDTITINELLNELNDSVDADEFNNRLCKCTEFLDNNTTIFNGNLFNAIDVTFHNKNTMKLLKNNNNCPDILSDKCFIINDMEYYVGNFILIFKYLTDPIYHNEIKNKVIEEITFKKEKITNKFNKKIKSFIDVKTGKKIKYNKETIFDLILNWFIKRYDENSIFDNEINLFFNNDYSWISESDLISDILL
jgi:hypothetical protein